MKNAPKAAALLCTAALVCAGGAVSSSRAAEPTVPGWPAYIAMGGIGGIDGPSNNGINIGSLSCSTPAGTGNDDFQGAPVDVIFTYAGSGGFDAGIIVPPFKALAMTQELTTLSSCANNQHATRVALVEYTADLSGGEATLLNDLSNSPNASSASPYGNYIMARHLITLGADAMALNGPQVPACTGAKQGVTCNGQPVGGPVTYNGSNYYGTLIMNPDMLGTLEQNSPPATNSANWVTDANNVLNNSTGMAPGGVNKAVSMALCFLTNTYSYTNTFNPNDQAVGTVAYDTTYTGTPVAIMEQMLADGYPPYSLNQSTSDPYWPTSVNNLDSPSGDPPSGTNSQVAVWLNACAANPTYNTTTYQPPSFPNTLDGWVQANNWLIRALSPKGNVTFGWHEDMYAAGGNGDFWLQKQLTNAQVASAYSTPVTSWLQANAPDVISSGAGTLGASYVPDYFVFDRFGEDDSNDGSYNEGATLYNAQSWDNYLTGVGQVSTNFNNIPVMMWQIPGSHISNTTESNPETTANGYVFSTAPVYFFGDSNLTSNLSNIIMGPASTSDPSTAVGNFDIAGSGYCGPSFYNCASDASPYYYKQWLLYYQGQANNYNWSIDNGKRTKAAANHVFAILWGAGGAASNPVANPDSSPDNDHGWLAAKIINYYLHPTPLSPELASTHDFNGDGYSDFAWRNTSSGDVSTWLMDGTTVSQASDFANVPIAANWSIVGQRDFNGDGDADLLWRNSNGDTSIWLINGTTISQATDLGIVPTAWSVAGTGDFNGDGKGDILWRNTSTGDVTIWLMTGTTNSVSILQSADFANVPVASGWTIAGTGDFNGDGKTDILWRNTSTGDVAIWLMNGTTILQATDFANVPVAANWNIADTGDFNGDGMSDILWHNASTGDVSIWLMNGTTVSQATDFANVPLASNWKIAETGDYNGDGKSDIAWHNASTGDVSIWLMNGAAISQSTDFVNVPIASGWAMQTLNTE